MKTNKKCELNSERDLPKLIGAIRDRIHSWHEDIPKQSLSRMIRKELLSMDINYPVVLNEEEIEDYTAKVYAKLQDSLKEMSDSQNSKKPNKVKKTDYRKNKRTTMIFAIVLYALALVMLIATVFTDNATFLVLLVIAFAGASIATSSCIEYSKKLDIAEENPPSDNLPVGFTIGLTTLFVVAFLVLCP